MADDDSVKTFVERMRREREEKGWSQADLAREAKVSGGWISRLESGETHDISLTTARKIARALRVSVDYLAGDLWGSERVPAGMGQLGGYAIPAR